MSANPNIAQRYRRRAEELRTMAAESAAGIRDKLDRLADVYDQLTLSAEALSWTDRVFNNGLHLRKNFAEQLREPHGP